MQNALLINFSKCQWAYTPPMVVNVQQCSSLHGMIYLHNDIFLTDIIGYDRLKFS